MSERPFPIAYVAGAFPLRSETFVWREVRELRRRGWPVYTFGLRAPTERTPPELADLREATRDVYGEGFPKHRLVRPALFNRREQARANVFWQSVCDAAIPGEATAVPDRLKLVRQGLAATALGQILEELDVEHVHAHFAHAATTVAMYAAQYAGIGYSFTGHANDIFQRRQLLRRKLQRASFVSCISNWHRDFYESVAPGKGRYDVIRCGVLVKDYGPPPGPLGDGTLRVLTVARLVEKKGIDTLIHAADRVPAVRVTVAGDGPMRAQLESLASTSGGRVAFLGPVSPSAVAGLLREHDAFALPCRADENGDRDGIPVALMEAMASGLPTLSGDLPAIRELIEDGVTGRLVPGGDAGAVAAVLGEWCANARERLELGQRARTWVEQEFSLAKTGDRLEAAFYRAQALGRCSG